MMQRQFSIKLYHVYNGRISDSPLQTFETLYLGEDEEQAYKIYDKHRFNSHVHIRTENQEFIFFY